MKKLFLIITTLLISLLLSGCDLLGSDQVDQISEEFCRDNPTSEICNGDPVGALEDGIILGIFEKIIDEYNDLENETFCDDYFAVTNTELLDECRDHRNDLVPEDYTGYTVVDVIKKTTLSTEDIYEVNVISTDELTEIVFTIGLVSIEGIMYINLWSYDINTVEPQALVMTLAIAQEYFEKFLVDYLNIDIDSAVICSEYFADKPAADCIADRTESLAMGLTVTFEGITDTGEGTYEVELYFSDTDNPTPTLEFEDVKIDYDELGNIVMEFVDDDSDMEFLTDEEVFGVMQEFINDYLNESFTDQQLNDKYFDGTMDIEFFNRRATDIFEGVTLEVLSAVNPNGDDNFAFIDVGIRRINDGNIDDSIIQVRVKGFEDGTYYLELIFNEYLENYLNPSDAYAVIAQFIIDYLDPGVSHEQLAEIYFDYNMMDLEFRDDREQDQIFNVTYELISVVNYYPDDPSAYLEVEFIRTKEGESETIFVPMRVVELEEGRYYIEVMFNGNDSDYGMLYGFIEELLFQYLDDTFTDDMVCNYFFEGEDATKCLEDRQTEMLEVDSIEFIGLYFYDGMYEVEFLFNFADDTIKLQDFKLEYYYNELDELKIRFIEEYSNFPYDEAWNHINNLVNDFNDPDLDSITVCTTYFEEMDVEGCIEKRETDIMNNIFIAGFTLNEEYNGFVLELIYEDEFGYNWTEIIFAEFLYNIDNQLYVRFNGEYHELIHREMAWEFLIAYQNAFNDFGYDLDALCTDFFGDSSFQYCIDRREDAMINNLYIVINDLYEMDGMYFAVIEYYSGDEGYQFTEDILVHFFYDDMDMLRMDIDFNMQNHVDHDEAFAFFNQFIIDFLDPTITDAEFCYMYFPWQDSTTCIWDRANISFADMVITIDYFRNDYENYEIGVTFLDTFTSIQRSEVLFVNFFYNELGQVEMNIYYQIYGGYVDLATAITVFTDYVDDYVDPLVTFQYINETYFDIRMDFEFDIERQLAFTNGTIFTVLSITDPANGDGTEWIKVEIQREENGVTGVMLVWMKVFLLDNGNYLIEFSHMDYPQPVVSYDDAFAYLEVFIIDWNNLSLTSEFVCSTYFDPEDYPECFNKRENDIMIGQYTVLQSLIQFPDGYFVDLGYFNTSDEFLYNEFIPVFFYYDMDDVLKIKYHYDDYQGPFLNFDEAFSMLDMYYIDFMDETILSFDFCSMYHEGWMIDECVELRDDIFANNYFIALGDFYTEDYMYVVVVDYYDADGLYVISHTFEVNFYENFSTIYFDLHLHYGEFDPWLELATPVIEGYFEDYDDFTIPSEVVCSMFIADPLACSILRDQFIADGLVYVDLWDTYYYKNEDDIAHYIVIVYFEYDLGNYEIREYEVFFTQNNEDPFFYSLELRGMEISVPVGAVLLPEPDAVVVLTQFALDYADNTITHQELCDLYFGGVFTSPDCMEGRQEFLDGLGIATFLYADIEIDFAEVEFYMAYFEMTMDGETFIQNGSFRVYLLTDGSHFIEFVKTEYYPDPV